MPTTERVTITEADGGPSIRNVAEIVFDNGSVTNQGGGVVRVANGGGGGGAGSVTSVALTAPAIFSVAGSPITSTGTLALTLATQTANRVWAGPTTGSAAAPTFRALVAADLPSIILTSGVTGTLPIANGGTGATTATTAFDALSPMSAVGDMIYGGAAGTRTRLAGNTTATRMFLLQVGNGSVSAAPSWATLTAADLPNAVSDGSTKGVATFVAADFTDSGGVIGIDYANGQAASASLKGFLTAADWSSFNAKISPINGGLDELDDSHGNMGSTETFSLAAGNWHTGTLDANCTFTISGWTADFGCTIFLGLRQDATGGRTITWPVAVVNPPTISTAANAITWVSLWSIDGGTTIYASTPAALSATGTLDTLGSTRGSILYRGASSWAALTPGTAGQVLQSGGAGADPSWVSVGTGDVTAASNFGTDNAVLRADGTLKGSQSSSVFITDAALLGVGRAPTYAFESYTASGDHKVAFCSALVAHGITGRTLTDAWGYMEMDDPTNGGGLSLEGFTHSTTVSTTSAMRIIGTWGVSTAPASGATPCVLVRGQKKDGTDVQALAATDVLFALDNLSTRVVSVDATGSFTVCAATATPASGSTAARLLFGTTAGLGIYYGSGAPTVSAAQGSIYIRSNGTTTNDRIYVNNSSGSGTTWTALTSAA